MAEHLNIALQMSWQFWHQPGKSGDPFLTSAQVFELSRHTLGREGVEVVWLLLLDARLCKISFQEIFRGTVTGSILHPREVLQRALLAGAAGFILVHNHPSGNPRPSAEDERITRVLSRAANLVQIDFIDHMIVTPHHYFSFTDARKMR